MSESAFIYTSLISCSARFSMSWSLSRLPIAFSHWVVLADKSKIVKPSMASRTSSDCSTSNMALAMGGNSQISSAISLGKTTDSRFTFSGSDTGAECIVFVDKKVYFGGVRLWH